MTLAQLLEVDVDQLEKLTDAQLDEICKPFYQITRPELAASDRKQSSLNLNVPRTNKSMSPEERNKRNQIEVAKALAKSMGYNIK